MKNNLGNLNKQNSVPRETNNEIVEKIQDSHKSTQKEEILKQKSLTYKKKKNISQNIPFSHLKSYMFERCEIPKETRIQRDLRYANIDPTLKIVESILSRILRHLKALKPTRKWAYYRLIMTSLHYFFKVFYRQEMHGKENIPKEGGIFVTNHIEGPDVVVPFLAEFRKPIGPFTDMGNGFIVDVVEQFGVIPRRGVASIMIEKMIRKLALMNRYLIMWPEGTPDKGKGVMQGFSGIVRVYATLNSDKNRIPFVPVVTLDYSPFWNGKNHSPKKIVYHILKPVYLPREWLLSPQDGGKTQREIIDYVMLKIANKMGQKELAPNPVLNRRKKPNRTQWH